MRSLSAVVVLLSACTALRTQGRPAQESLEDVFARVHTSVVTIRTSGRTIDLDDESGTMTSIAGLGSGVVVSKDGKILTAAHVVHLADAVFVEFESGELRRARVLASDRFHDVALIELTGSIPDDVHVAKLADSDDVRVGREVFAVGAPRGMTHTLTVGHISARRKPHGGPRTLFDTELFQTDAAINEGNSGGPLFDMRGEVIGIVSHMLTASGGNEGLGFAVTSNIARKSLLESPSFWSGVEVMVVTGPLARVLNLPKGRSGLLVQYVARRSPSEALGLRGGEVAARVGDQTFVAGGDVILKVQDVDIDETGSFEAIRTAFEQLQDGADLRVVVLRAGELVELTATVAR